MNKPTGKTNDNTIFLIVLTVIGLIVPVLCCGMGVVMFGVRTSRVMTGPATQGTFASPMTLPSSSNAQTPALSRALPLPKFDPRAIAARELVEENFSKSTMPGAGAPITHGQQFLDSDGDVAIVTGVFLANDNEYEYRCEVVKEVEDWKAKDITIQPYSDF